MQNSGQLYKTSYFDHKYLPTSKDIQNWRYVIDNDCSHVWWKKSGEITSTNKYDMWVWTHSNGLCWECRP